MDCLIFEIRLGQRQQHRDLEVTQYGGGLIYSLCEPWRHA